MTSNVYQTRHFITFHNNTSLASKLMVTTVASREQVQNKLVDLYGDSWKEVLTEQETYRLLPSFYNNEAKWVHFGEPVVKIIDKDTIIAYLPNADNPRNRIQHWKLELNFPMYELKKIDDNYQERVKANAKGLSYALFDKIINNIEDYTKKLADDFILDSDEVEFTFGSSGIYRLTVSISAYGYCWAEIEVI